jgi:hypothetical protein
MSKKDDIHINNNYNSIINTNTNTNNTETKSTIPPSKFYDFKKAVGLENYSDGSFILYFFLIVFIIQKTKDIVTIINNVIILPKQVIDTYHYITKEDLIIQDRIDDLMNQLLGVLDADRITIAKIHNGTFDHTNSHQMKLSMIYEVLSDGTKSNKKEIQNIPLKSIKKEIELGSTVSYKKIDEIDSEYTVNSYIDKVDSTTKYYKLLAINKDIYGILEIHLINKSSEDFLCNKSLTKRVYKISNELEDCLQSILLKRTWIQKTFSKIFKFNPLYR